MPKLFVLLLFAVTPELLWAQANPYVVNFETGYTHPAVKSYSALDTVWADSIPWKMPGVYLGTMTANDFANGSHAARFRLTNNTTGNPAYIEMLRDLPGGVQAIEFYTAMYGTETGGSLLVSYSVDSGQSWIPAGDTVWVTASHDSAMKVSFEPGVSQAVRIKIANAGTEDVRIDVDDISMTSFGTGKYVLVNNLFPLGNNVSINTDTLKIYFDHTVVPNHGKLSLIQSGGATQEILVPSAQVAVLDSVVLFSGIHLEDNADYFVLMTDSLFFDSTHQLYSRAIVDSGFWYFRTEDTFLSPGIVPLAGLAESFLACNDAQNLVGVFHSYNVKGNQKWTCTSEGHEDSFAVSISGGFGKDVSADNEDWIISTLPFDLSFQENPVLSFWQKGRYEGFVIRDIRISTDYPGNGSPVADSVHWTILNIPGMNEIPDDQWTLVDGIELAPFRNQQFYLAFTYTCERNGAYKLFYDDIRIQTPTHIVMQDSKRFSACVLGLASGDEIHLRISTDKQRKMNITVYNLQGQKITQCSMPVAEGVSHVSCAVPDLASGLYLMRLFDGQQLAFLRFLVP